MSDLRDRAERWVRENEARILGYARDLIAIDTTAVEPGEEPHDEAALQAVVAGWFREMGLEVDQFEPDPSRLRSHPMYRQGQTWRGRPVTVGIRRGEGGGRSLILNGHIDTASAGPREGWTVTDPFRPVLREGRLYGRGSTDMKAGVASFVAATAAVRELGIRLRGDLILEVVTDEEINGMGTVAVIDRGYRADAAIVPEPSDLALWTAKRGILVGKVTVHGRIGHAELPQPHWRDGGAVNAILKAVEVVSAIEALNREWQGRPDKLHPLLDTPVLHVTKIEGGEFVASYPGRCEITVDGTYLPQNADPEGFGSLVKAEVEAQIRLGTAADPWLREHPPQVAWLMDYPAGELAPEAPIATTLAGVVRGMGLPVRVRGLNSWDDAVSLMRFAGVPALSFGPGPSETAHAFDEYVEVEKVLLTVRALIETISRWCGTA